MTIGIAIAVPDGIALAALPRTARAGPNVWSGVVKNFDEVEYWKFLFPGWKGEK